MTDLSTSVDAAEAVQPVPDCPAHANAVQLSGLQYQQAPAELYRSLRRDHGAVAPAVLEGGFPAWLVLGYPEVCYVTSHDKLFARDSRRWNQWGNIPSDWPLMPLVGYQPSVMFAEGAEHQRRAGVISEALDSVDQFQLAHDCRRIAEQLIAVFAGSGQAELMSAYASAVPMRATVQMCGMSSGGTDTEDLVRDLRISLDVTQDVTLGDPIAAYARARKRILQLVEDKRTRPGPDVTSQMVSHPAGLTDEEIVHDLVLTISATQATSHWIGNTLQLLLTDDRFALKVSGGRVSVDQALNEVLWRETPVQNMVGRWAVRDTQLGGRQIKAGDCLILGLAAANTDPHIWPAGRIGAQGNAAHLSFSNGEHGCPYPAPQLAEIIARTAIEVLLEQLPDLMLAVDPSELTWRTSMFLRTLTTLPVEFTPGAGTV